MTHVVDALGSGKGPDLDAAALMMVDVATNVGSDESVRAAAFLARCFLILALFCCLRAYDLRRFPRRASSHPASWR